MYEAREHEVRPTPCTVDRELRLVRSRDGPASWPLPEFDPTPVEKQRTFVAMGAKLVPWPSKEKPAWDVMDDGTKIEITPEHIDQVAEHAHKLGRLAAVGEMSLTDRLVHMAAGAALGLVLGFILIKYLGFSIVHGNAGTTVTITNTTAANATKLANSAMLPIVARFGRFKLRARCACEARELAPMRVRDPCDAYVTHTRTELERAGVQFGDEPVPKWFWERCWNCSHNRACHKEERA